MFGQNKIILPTEANPQTNSCCAKQRTESATNSHVATCEVQVTLQDPALQLNQLRARAKSTEEADPNETLKQHSQGRQCKMKE